MKQYEYVVRVRGDIGMDTRIRTALEQACGLRQEDITVTPSLDSSYFPDIEVPGLAERCEQDMGNEEFIEFLDDLSAVCTTDNPRLLAERLYPIFLRQFSVEYAKHFAGVFIEDVLSDFGVRLPDRLENEMGKNNREQLRQEIEAML